MIPIPTTELVTQTDAGTTVISYHQGVCKAATLNKTGYSVWQLMDGKRTIREITTLIVAPLALHSAVDAESVHKDVEAFIAALEEGGFVRLAARENQEGQNSEQ